MRERTYKLAQDRAPLLDALTEYRRGRVVPFDVPGHKQGRGTPELTEFLGKSCLSVDVNSMKPLDNLSHPTSVITEALAADAFGADDAFLIIGGTTAAVQAMIMSVCKRGDSIIIPRNVHKSAINALILCGIIPVYVDPGIHPELGISLGMSADDVEAAIAAHPEAKAVFVNNPTYYGICADLRRITEAAHRAGMAALIDEAHGTHFYFGGDMPLTAMEAGVARWLKLYFRGTGTVTLHAAGMLVHEYPDAHRASFLCSDGDVNRLYDAAKRTLLCNTQDIFMDCPDRERGGWLCDSLWTARAAAMLLGDTRVEREFLETFLLTPADGMFRGFFPETYPGSKADYAAMTGITTWSFWLMCELCEYVRRTGDTALRDRFADRVAAFVDGSRSFLGQSGLLERLPWLFIDWSVSNYGEYQTPISVPANALYAYTLAALGGLYTRSDWCAEGERMRGILRAAVLDGRLPETVRTIPDSLERHPDGRLHGRGRCSETGIATCLWADLFAPGELPALDAAFRDCMGFSPRFAPDPEIGRSQLFIGLCIRLDALARRGCYDRLYGELNALYLPVLKHLRQRNVLAQRGFQVKPVPFPRNKLHAPAALADGAEEIVWFGYV